MTWPVVFLILGCLALFLAFTWGCFSLASRQRIAEIDAKEKAKLVAEFMRSQKPPEAGETARSPGAFQ